MEKLVKIPTTREYWEKYDRLCRSWRVALGGAEFMGLSRPRMVERLRADPYLNTVATLHAWDAASAHLRGKPTGGVGGGASIAEAVCAMKHAVLVWAGVQPVFVPFDDPSLNGDYPRLPEWN